MLNRPHLIPPERLGPEIQQVYREGVRAVREGAHILIRGEEGTGKAVMGHWLHQASGRAGRPIVAENAGGIPFDLTNEVLFGSRLPGAHYPEGLLERAHRSCLVLQTLEELHVDSLRPLHAALEARAVLPVGAVDPVPADVQLLATLGALNRAPTPEELDLFDVELFIPPLRERPSDIRVLAPHYLHTIQFVGREVRPPAISPSAMAILERGWWTMNLRGLMQWMSQLAVLHSGGTIEPEHLSRLQLRDHS